MSKTLKVSNGDIHIDEATGRSKLISGPDLIIQTIVEELMTEYDPVTSRGSKIRQLNNLSLIRQEVLETVDRIKERQSEDTAITHREQIDRVTQLVVQSYDQVTVFFYLEVTSTAKDKKQALLVMEQNGNLIQVDQQFLP
jgi:hypothetical protein